MSAKAPITQDVMTIPRKLPEGTINLVGLTRDRLREVLIEHGTPEKQAKMRVNQIWQWIYQWGVRDFDQMTNLAKAYRAQLAENFVIEIPEVVTRQVSEDGTRKYLVRIAGGHEVEVVYIPEEDRGTLCISSQVGCTLTCSFCHTGTQKLVRNLTAAEIIGQVMMARDDLDEWPTPGAPKNETLLEKYGDIHWDEVHQIMTSLLAGGGGTPARIETWVNWLLERKHVAEAKTWAAKSSAARLVKNQWLPRRPNGERYPYIRVGSSTNATNHVTRKLLTSTLSRK